MKLIFENHHYYEFTTLPLKNSLNNSTSVNSVILLRYMNSKLAAKYYLNYDTARWHLGKAMSSV